MAKSELGTKRVCPETGRKFYDLNKDPVISPYTGHVVPVATIPVRSSRGEPAAARAAAAAAQAAEEAAVPETKEAEFVSLEEADAEAQGKKGEADEIEAGDDEIEIDPALDDSALIEEQEETDDDVTDIIGDVEDEEEA